MSNSGWTISSVPASTTAGGNRSTGTWMRATETMTFATSDSAGKDLTGSLIDWLPPGRDFTVISNTGATNLCSDADIAVYCCGTSTGTFVLLKDDLETTIDAAVKSSNYDVSSNGEAPFYKIFIDSDDVQKATDTVVIDIVWYEGEREQD